MKVLCAKTSGSNMRSLFPSISELKSGIDQDSETLMSHKISQQSTSISCKEHTQEW